MTPQLANATALFLIGSVLIAMWIGALGAVAGVGR